MVLLCCKNIHYVEWRLKMFDKKLVEKISIDDICYKEDNTYKIKLPLEIQEYFKFLLKDTNRTATDNVEYVYATIDWIDRSSFHFVFLFECQTVDMTKIFACKHINDLVIEKRKNNDKDTGKDAFYIKDTLAKRKFEVTITRTGSIVVEAETADKAFDMVLNMTTHDIDKSADENLTGWEPSDVKEAE